MNILIINFKDIKHPKAGGSELYFHEMAKVWIKEGHKVFWISGGWKKCKKKEIVDGVNIKRVGKRFSVYLLVPFEYFRLQEKIDLIIDVENGIPFFTPLFSKIKKVLHIHHIHKDIWFKEMKFPFSYIGCFLESVVMPRVYKNEKIITISDSSANEILKENYSSSYPKIVNPGINFNTYKKFNKTKKPSILFLNRIMKYKGLLILLKAIKILQGKNKKDLDLWIAGYGDDIERMKKYVKKNNLKNVEFFGKISEEEKIGLMQKAWIFVNPSFKEGWGIVNIEANYFGTPVIGSDIGGIKDSIVDKKTGLLFEYGNERELAEKIESLLENEELRKELSKEAVKWAKKFSWERTAKEYLKAIY